MGEISKIKISLEGNGNLRDCNDNKVFLVRMSDIIKLDRKDIDFGIYPTSFQSKLLLNNLLLHFKPFSFTNKINEKRNNITEVYIEDTNMRYKYKGLRLDKILNDYQKYIPFINGDIISNKKIYYEGEVVLTKSINSLKHFTYNIDDDISKDLLYRKNIPISLNNNEEMIILCNNSNGYSTKIILTYNGFEYWSGIDILSIPFKKIYPYSKIEYHLFKKLDGYLSEYTEFYDILYDEFIDILSFVSPKKKIVKNKNISINVEVICQKTKILFDQFEKIQNKKINNRIPLYPIHSKISLKDRDKIFESMDYILSTKETKYFGVLVKCIPYQYTLSLINRLNIIDLTPITILECLYQTDNYSLQAYLTKRFISLEDKEIIHYLPQFVNLMHNSPIFSPMSYYLLLKASRNIYICNYLFWELFQYESIYLRILIEIMSESLYKKFRKSVEAISFIKECGCIDYINNISYEGMILPIDPMFNVKKIVKEKCKLIKSNTRPFLLVFEDENGNQKKVIFKKGDDMRIDKYALQLFNILEDIWIDENIPLKPYDIITFSKDCGMIEVVEDSLTSAEIQRGFQKSSLSFTNAFSNEALYEWLREKNSNDYIFENVRRTFFRSCAGYCVATYLLGIGDRHNDNIMCTSYGRVFHIDFGFFFGQESKFMGISKEFTQFVLTKDFIVMLGGEGSEDFNNFRRLCKELFILARKEYHTFITINEMSRKNLGLNRDTSYYIHDKLFVDENDYIHKFYQIFDDSVSSLFPRVNFAFHMLNYDFKKFFG